MVLSSNKLIKKLQSDPLPDLPMEAGDIFPNYTGASIINLPASVCRWLAVQPFGAPPLAHDWLSNIPGQYDQVVLLLIDGLGYDFLTRIVAGDFSGVRGLEFWGDRFDECPLLPLTSVSPSTTCAALSSLWTAAPPLQHGMLAYEMWLKEFGILSNMISFSPASARSQTGGLKHSGFDPQRFLPLPTFGDHLSGQGVETIVLQHTSIARSDLSLMLSARSEVYAFRAGSDLWLSLAEILAQPKGGKRFIYVYWGALDELMHFYGPEDERVLLELSAFTLQMRYFLDKLPKQGKKPLMLITADHGQIHTPKQPAYDLRNHPQMVNCLTIMPSGESRLPFLFVRPRREDRLRDYVEKTWGKSFPMAAAETVLTSGLMGVLSVDHPHRERLGDWVVFPRGDAYWWWSDRDNPFLGRHGGLSRQEMLVPLLPIIW